MNSVTRLGDFLHFWQFLKPLAAINLPKSPPFLGKFCKGVNIYHFSFLGNFYRHLAIFIWSRWLRTPTYLPALSHCYRLILSHITRYKLSLTNTALSLPLVITLTFISFHYLHFLPICMLDSESTVFICKFV